MPASVTWRGPTDSLVEIPESPVVDIGETITRTRTYRGLYTLCESSLLPKDTAGTGDEAGYVVIRCTAAKERGDAGKLTVVWGPADGSSGQDLPPDEFTCEPFEVRPNIQNLPYLTAALSGLTAAVRAKNLDSLAMYLKGSDADRHKAESWIAASGAAATQNVLAIVQRGVETWYLAGIKFSYTFSSWALPALTLGGYVETPSGTGFPSITGTLSWLRLSDSWGRSGSIYKTTRSWLGAPNGYWDSTLYPS